MSLDLEPVSRKIKVPCSFVVLNKPVLIKLMPSQASMGVLPPVGREEPSTDTKGSSLPSSFWTQLPTLPSQLTAAHGYSPLTTPALGLLWHYYVLRQREGGYQPFPSPTSARSRPSIPTASMAGTQQMMVPSPGRYPGTAKGALSGEHHGNPVPWTPQEGKTNQEILQRCICHSICSKTCWRPHRAS